MLSRKVISVLLTGDCVTTVLLQNAIYWAEYGETVWFISPTPLNSVPEVFNKLSDKEALKFIIFMYIPNQKDLITKFSEMHMLPKLPKTIIISEIDYYMSTSKKKVDLTNSSFLIGLLLDGASIYSQKHHESCFFISSTKGDTDNHEHKILETVLDFYFSHKLDTNSTEIFNNIEIVFKT